ncbi:hypothetical protein ACTFIW_005366 [Dictyostelium discoideum]
MLEYEQSMIYLSTDQIFKVASFRNDKQSLENYIHGLLEIVKNNKIKCSGKGSLRGSSFNLNIIINHVLLTGNIFLIEEIFKSNIIEVINSEFIFKSINSKETMNLVSRYYGDLLFSESNFNYIYLKGSKLVHHYETIMKGLDRKALVISYGDMVKKSKGDANLGIFSSFLNALSNPLVYIISDEIKKSYFDNIHMISNYKTFIGMMKEIPTGSSIRVNEVGSMEIINGNLEIGEDSVELVISNGIPNNVFRYGSKRITLSIPYFIFLDCLIKNDKKMALNQLYYMFLKHDQSGNIYMGYLGYIIH